MKIDKILVVVTPRSTDTEIAIEVEVTGEKHAATIYAEAQSDRVRWDLNDWLTRVEEEITSMLRRGREA